MINGFKRSYKGRIVDEVYTRLGRPTTRPSSRSCARRTPRRLFVFYPAEMGISFLRQYSEAGIARTVPAVLGVYGGRDFDPAVKHAALGHTRRATGAPT